MVTCLTVLSTWRWSNLTAPRLPFAGRSGSTWFAEASRVQGLLDPQP
jgi:hypothetical protein